MSAVLAELDRAESGMCYQWIYTSMNVLCCRVALALGLSYVLLVACSGSSGSSSAGPPTAGDGGLGGAAGDGAAQGGSDASSGGADAGANDGTAGGDAQGETVSTVIGPDGGALESSDGKLMLQVPAGALGAATTISITPVTEATLPSGALGAGYHLEPSGLAFAKPALLMFRYVPAELAGVTPSAVRIGTVSAGKWARLSATIVDAAQGTLSALTEHFSVFGKFHEQCSGKTGECFWSEHEACVSGLAPKPVCAIPCVAQADCPSPLYCIEGACALQGCFGQPSLCTQAGHTCEHTYGYTNVEAKHHNVMCLPDCDPLAGTNCPGHPHMACYAPRCDTFRSCTSDAGCNAGELCYHGGLLEWAGNVGECLPCELGCDCDDPKCPCVDGSPQKRCKDDYSPFAGIWKGNFGGTASGTWNAIIELSGWVTGDHTGTGPGGVPADGVISGTIAPDGTASMLAKGSGGAACPWTGTFTPSNASGTWSCDALASGGWSGSKTAPLSPYRGTWSGTFTGGASGAWNVSIDALGKASGSMKGTSPLGTFDYPLVGQIQADGAASFSANGGTCTMPGKAVGNFASGTWLCGGLASGTWTGSKVDG